MVDVDFEWFDPQPGVDFHGIKTLLRQLFDADAQMFDLSALTDLILEQPLLGSTVKVDGNETDPYAFLTILNIKQHLVGKHRLMIFFWFHYLPFLKEKPAVRDLVQYLNGRATKSTSPGISGVMNSAQVTVGLILTERLINVPTEVAPPMYKMLLEEIQWAIEEKEPYAFTHFLLISKTYQELESQADEEDDSTRKHKKQKKTNTNGNVETFYFHPEDKVLHKHTAAFGDFDYVKEKADGHSDSKRTFHELGIKPKGHMILIEAARFETAIKDIQAYFGQS